MSMNRVSRWKEMTTDFSFTEFGLLGCYMDSLLLRLECMENLIFKDTR